MDKKDKIVKIVPSEIRPNQDAVEMLEGIIERVKAGDISCVGLAYTTKEGSVGGDISEGNDNFLMWASLEHLAREFYAKTILGGE